MQSFQNCYRFVSEKSRRSSKKKVLMILTTWVQTAQNNVAEHIWISLRLLNVTNTEEGLNASWSMNWWKAELVRIFYITNKSYQNILSWETEMHATRRRLKKGMHRDVDRDWGAETQMRKHRYVDIETRPQSHRDS